MQFSGRIQKVLPTRQGVSARTGAEWKALPFVFEYFENPTDRYSDKVMLESFDTKQFPQIREGAQVRIGFGHSVREWTNQEGKVQTFNEIRMYSFEVLGQVVVDAVPQQTATPPTAQPQAPAQPQQPQGAAQGGGQADDLPF